MLPQLSKEEAEQITILLRKIGYAVAVHPFSPGHENSLFRYDIREGSNRAFVADKSEPPQPEVTQE